MNSRDSRVNGVRPRWKTIEQIIIIILRTRKQHYYRKIGIKTEAPTMVEEQMCVYLFFLKSRDGGSWLETNDSQKVSEL